MMIEGGARASVVLFLAAMITLGGCASTRTTGGQGVTGMALESSTIDGSPTFYAEALPIFEKNCVACHQPNGPDVGGISAPMSLMTYEEASPWAPRIKEALRTGYMPPWGAHEQHQGTFKGERYYRRCRKEDADRMGRWGCTSREP